MRLADQLDQWLPPGETRRFGQLVLARSDSGPFSAHHEDDRGSEDSLEPVETAGELRELAKFRDDGEYRPLKTAPSLRSGWITHCDDAVEFLKRLDAIYPGVFATWVAYENEQLDPVPLRKTLDRQTGMYRFAGSITDQMANEIMRETCAKGCIRQIAWPIDDDCPTGRIKRTPRAIPVICTEACTFAVSEARRLAKEAYDKANAPATN